MAAEIPGIPMATWMLADLGMDVLWPGIEGMHAG